MSLLGQKVPIEEALEKPDLSDDERRKLQLTLKVREFAEKKLSLKPTKNYTGFVKLDRPYVTYVVSAAPKWELKHHLWYFPIVGHVPYKGYFNEKDAVEEEVSLKQENLDTYRRGVSAYSTLGWFQDPLLSSMLRYKDHDLVNTIIHETVHATIYIKSSADFNERLAVFLGNKGTDLFYTELEGTQSPTLTMIKNENADDKLFSTFITAQIQELENWYKALPKAEQNEEIRKERIKQIQINFEKELKPKLQSDSYKRFSEIELNNARLLVYKTYMQDLSDFERLFDLVKGDWQLYIKCCEKIKENKKPEEGLKDLLNQGVAACTQK